MIFRNWILENFPFLEDDFDALTDYELFCKMMEYVKKFAKDNEEFKKQLKDLEDYIYNLNLQDEVNNKLDEMAESGQLEEIIAQYLTLITNLTFITVSDMKQATNLANGNYVKTLGFYEVGDGGSSYYHIRNVTNDDVIDEHFIIAVNDVNLVAEFIMIGKDLHSKQIGLKGDNSTDETTIIQKYFDYKNNYDINKIFDEGIYIISDTINIKGKWQQDGQNDSGYKNGQYNIKFNNATFKVTDNTLDYSFKIYNFWEGIIDGLCITRNSQASPKVLISGCWRTIFKNWEIKQLEINTNPDLIDDTLLAYSCQHLVFDNIYFRGHVIIDPYSETNEYINGITFNNCQLYSYGYDECVLLKKSFSKQQITFNNCDLSYATSYVFNVDVAQVNPYITSAISSCHITTINCYFDSNILMFKNNNLNNIEYSEYGSRFSGTEVQNYNQTMSEYFTTTKIGVSGNHVKPQLPISNLNLTYNGDMSSHTYESANSSQLFGASDTDITKSYESNDYQKNGYVRKLVFNTTTNKSLTANGRKYIYNAPAVAGLIFEVVSGGCDIGLKMGTTNQTFTITKDKIKSGINIITCNKGNVSFVQGSWSDLTISFSNITSGTVINIYEVGVQMGAIYIPNAQLIKSAIPTT
ncbi:MAG: hypothetical protein J6T10_06730 [Methanobrevibacter sp.]|nr:hypothetical protein [Methanobrevibacter sp.]